MKSVPETTGLYNSFKENNLSLISELNRAIDLLLKEIADDQNNLIDKIEDINNKIIELRSIFFSFHSMAGSEKLIRLKELINFYRYDSEKNKSRIAAADFLVRKIGELLLKHDHENYEPFRTTGNISDIYENKMIPINDEGSRVNSRYKWITFSRNNSWFISRFTELKIIEVKEFHPHSTINSKITLETPDNEKIDAVDLMRGTETATKPLIGIRLNHNSNFFAADSKGKEIYASKDFITPMKIRLDINNPLYSGRVRLFGKNHLSLVSEKI